MKRIFAVILATIMMFSALPADIVFATETTDVVLADETDAENIEQQTDIVESDLTADTEDEDSTVEGMDEASADGTDLVEISTGETGDLQGMEDDVKDTDTGTELSLEEFVVENEPAENDVPESDALEKDEKQSETEEHDSSDNQQEANKKIQSESEMDEEEITFISIIPEPDGGTGEKYTYEDNGDGTITITGLSSGTIVTGTLEIPNLIDGKTVTAIGEYAFSRCSDFSSITIPSSVTEIKHGAFSECTGLTQVTIPGNVRTIGDYAFDRCSGITSLILQNGITTIGKDVFYKCSELSKIEFPGSLRAIGDGAFYYCSGLKGDLIIPNGVSTIEKAAFYGCTGITNLSLPESLRTIGTCAFYDCIGLNIPLTIPEGVTTIGGGAFSAGTSYASSSFTGTLTLPSTLTSIEQNALFHLYKINKVINNSNVRINASNFITRDSGECFVDETGHIVVATEGFVDMGKGTWTRMRLDDVVTIKNVPVSGVKISKSSVSVAKGYTIALKAKVSPDNATNKKVTWKSSNKKIATVDKNGVVKGIKKGTATITCTATDGSGKKATCKITVKNPVKVKSVKLNKSKVTVKKKKTVQLKATISPKNATNKDVTWKSSNKKIATVDKNGVVKGIKKGTATITVTTKDGKKTAKCKVTVK